MADDAGPLAFFSYSRDDVEFARKLAKDLREGGAAVWRQDRAFQGRFVSAVAAGIAQQCGMRDGGGKDGAPDRRR